MNVEKWTDGELARLEKRIAKEYEKASAELHTTATEYFEKYKTRWEKEHQAYLAGKYTDEQFKQWEYAQLGRGQHWIDLKEQMVKRLEDSAKITADYSNNILPAVYVKNSNAVAEIAQKAAMEEGVTGIRFDLVDEYTVRRLMEGSREVRPYRAIDINIPKYNKYNYTKLQNALLQGILMGDDIGKLASRFESVSNTSRAVAIRNARTAVTGARSAGKQDRYEDLAKQGCIVTKKWVATEDGRTRPEHAEADGQEVPYDEPFDVGEEELMYPGDKNGSGWNIYNCRCTMKTGKITFKSVMSEETRQFANIRVKK